jgi:molecular chaperone HtpG
MGTFTTDFDGLLSLLANHLYADAEVFVRELIQNAQDAIIRARDAGHSRAGHIDISADRDKRLLKFRDDGIGMTEDEIVRYLSTIGCSGTDAVRQQMQLQDPNKALQLIGRFGIGFLSAFVVADTIVIETQSRKSGSPRLRWTTNGGGTYYLGPVDSSHPGTTIEISLKPEFLWMANETHLETVIRRHADFIPFPINLNYKGPINAQKAPWDQSYPNEDARLNAYDTWLRERFPDTPLLILPVNLETPYPVQGMLYVTSRHMPDVGKAGVVDLYVARMMVQPDFPHLLPPWAHFVRGVIDCPVLTPTAARDAVQLDDKLKPILDALSTLIIEGLRHLAKTDRDKFVVLQYLHHHYLKGMALQDDNLFADLAEILCFETGVSDQNGQKPSYMTLAEYTARQTERDAFGKTVLYYLKEDEASALLDICKASGRLILQAGRPYEEAFLQRYVQQNPQLSLRRVDLGSGAGLFETLLPEEKTHFEQARRALAEWLNKEFGTQTPRVVLERYAPIDMPAVLTFVHHGNDSGPMVDPTMPPILRQLYAGYEEHAPPPILHLNITSPQVRQLLAAPLSDAAVRTAWLLLYTNALALSRRPPTPQHLADLRHASLAQINDLSR